MVCSTCGTPASDGARFCPGCGRALHGADDERRVVTVLFADLVGFTTLSERLDPERVKNLVDGCFDQLAAEVTAFGGQVDKIVGDAMVALFGAPVAHEDDAERAVRAALRMQATLATGSHDLGEALQIRIGINTGEVLVGAMRAAGSITAMGDVVNTASRLQSAARPGEVLVGRSTHGATNQAIAYESHGLVDAKGREEPVETWRAVAPISTPGFRARRVDVPLVGRDHEIGLLRHAVGSSIDNHRALLVLLVGDVGMGKSRLADEAADWARSIHGAMIREGRCLPYGEANVWWPVAESLRDGFAMADGLDRDEARVEVTPQVAAALGAGVEGRTGSEAVDRTVDGLLTLLGYEATSTVDPGTIRANAGMALAQYVGALTVKRPLLLQVSDLHWADEALLALIDDVVTTVHHRRLVVVATARPSLLDRWSPRSGRHNTMVLHLDPLDPASSAVLLEHLVGEPVPAEVADVILARSGGNPFYLEELVPLLGAGDDGDGAELVATLPDTLRGLVAARLDDLAPSARAVVQNASVIGHHGPVAGLRELGDQVGRGTDVDAALDRLVAEEVMEVVDGNWSFRSDLVREVAYQTITKAERAKCHLGIAHYLERMVASRRPRPVWVVDQLAHHYGTAVALAAELGPSDGSGALPTDLGDRARRWTVEAAERARRDRALPAATRRYDAAIDLIDAGRGATDEEQARIYLGRAAVAAEAWDLSVARRDVELACALADAADHAELCARALVVRGSVEQKEGDVDGAVATLTEAAASFSALDDQTGRADALRQRGMVQIFGGRLADAERSATEALEVFRTIDDRAGQAWAHQNLAWVSFVTGRTAEADGHVAEAIAAFTDLHDAQGLAWTNGLLSWVRFQQRRVGDAERLGADVLSDARARNDPWGTAMMTLLLASIRLWSGHVDEAVDLATDGLARFESIGDRYGQGQGEAVLGRALVMAGRVEEGFAVLARGQDRAGDAGPMGPGAGHLARTSLVAAALQIGEPDRAMAVVGAIGEVDIEGADDPAVGRGLLALQRGDVAGAARFLRVDTDGVDDPNLAAAQALYAAVSGDGDAVALADGVAAHAGVTHLDRMLAEVAAAIAACRSGSHDQVQKRIEAARSALGPTTDRVAPMVVDLAAAALARAAGDPEADELDRAARQRAAALGVQPGGWDRVLAAATDRSRPDLTI